ncbi:MAG: acyl-ACP--UDP-N-acetylglucosamine O-acyltransferase [Phycisphaerae bacterium]|nr:acyl-ACP--UDP-N-acetylglucosamine O-acyltransferase [Phycisphaerae bacterium]
MNARTAPIDPTATVHPTAQIDPSARIHADAVIEADAFVGPNCTVGRGTRLRARAMLIEHVTLGERNDVHPYAVLGGDPQDKSFDETKRGEVIIGDRNIIREHVTINRSNWNGGPTRVGSGCYLMCSTHLAHNAQIGDNVIMANGACLAGHARVGHGVVMSAFTMVHQFVIVGDGVMFRGGSGVGMHVPPFVVVAGENFIAGLNKVGLARNPAINRQDRDEVKRVYRALFREREATPIQDVIAQLRDETWGAAATKFIDFCADAIAKEPPHRRGLVGGRRMRVRTQSALMPALADTATG